MTIRLAEADSSGGLLAPLALSWSRDYHQEWDGQPEEYIAHGLVGWGRSRRLVRAEDRSVAFKAYVGVQHDDPARWHAPGAARSVFFLSLFVANRTVTLRTFPTFGIALQELRQFHQSLCPA